MQASTCLPKRHTIECFIYLPPNTLAHHKTSLPSYYTNDISLRISIDYSENVPTTAAKNIAAAAQKSQYLTFGLTQHYEMLHNVAELS